MALPPTIPTSFVPHSSGAPQRFRSDFTNAFGFLAYIILGVTFLVALGVFLYGRVLSANLVAKDAALAKATASIDQATVEGFVRLRNRLNQGGVLLNKHVAFSNFFATLENLLPASVRFTTLHLSLDASGVAKIEGAGVAKSFNALAALSSAFAADGRIKDAIFSKISINKDNSVSFGLSASLDPKLTAFSPSDSAARASTQVVPEETASAPASPEAAQGAITPTL
jgi:Tfp pilus assembly protein PilN